MDCKQEYIKQTSNVKPDVNCCSSSSTISFHDTSAVDSEPDANNKRTSDVGPDVAVSPLKTQAFMIEKATAKWNSPKQCTYNT
jgi:hypothetical protein